MKTRIYGRLWLVLLLVLAVTIGCKKPESDLSVAAVRERVAIDAARDCYLYNGADLVVYSDNHSTEVFRIDGATGAITSDSAISASGPLALAGPTAVGTATPILVVNQLGVSAPLEVRKAGTPIFQVNGSGNVDMEGSLDAAGPGKFVAPTAQATATPGLLVNSLGVNAPLEVQKAATKIFQVDSSGNAYILGTTSATGAVTVGGSGTGADVTFYSGTAGDLFLWDASEECLDVTGTNGQNGLRVLDGNASFADNVTVTGATVLNGGLAMDGTVFTVADTSGDTVIGGTLLVTGTATLSGGLAMDVNKFTVADTTGNTLIAGSLTANGGISADSGVFSVADVTGAVQAGGLTVGVSGTGADATFYSATTGDLMLWDASEECLDVTGTAGQNALRVLDGNVDFADALAVTGATTLTGALAANGGIATDGTAFTVADTSGNVGTTGTLTVGGVAALNGGLTMDATAFTVADTSGNTVIGGTLLVTGTATLNGGLAMDGAAFTVANTSGNTQVGGTLGVTGTTTLTGAAATVSTLTVGTFAIMGKAATVVVTNGSTIVPLGTYQPITSTAVVSTSLTTAIGNGATAGQLLILVNANAADAITIVEGNVFWAGGNDIILGARRSVWLMWDGTDWIVLGEWFTS